LSQHSRHSSELYEVLNVNLVNNPFLGEHLTVLETPHCRYGILVLTSGAIQSIVSKNQSHGPLQTTMENDVLSLYMSTLSLPYFDNIPQNKSLTKQSIFEVGSVTLRETYAVKRFSVTIENERAKIDGQPSALTLETTLFPFLFLFEKGGFASPGTSADYLKRRIRALFTCFTLYAPYLLLMYQLRNAVILLNSIRSIAFDQEVHRYVKKHPEATEEECIRNVFKHKLPPSFTGSPPYFRRHLKDLMAQVEAWRLPHFFLTLTADERSGLRWPKLSDLEAILQSLKASATWKDASVECLVQFCSRLHKFTKDFILTPGGGLLGRVVHHVTRFEFQHHGSCHAHIILCPRGRCQKGR
jgi:hypothetical protein